MNSTGRATWLPAIIAGMRLVGLKELYIVRDSNMTIQELDNCVAVSLFIYIYMYIFKIFSV